jgi:hypothetical protein
MAATMTVDQAIAKAFLHAQRKPVAPSAGTTKYNALLMIADSMQKMWAAEPGVEWDSLYALVTLSAVVSATDTFAIDATINDISQREGDSVLVTNGVSTTPFTVVDPDQLYGFRNSNVVARLGNTLKFSRAFASTSSMIGYNIKIPAIGYIADITAGSQTIAVDDPMWLVYSMAAEFCRNDTVKAGQYDNLLQMADQHMQKMKQANGGQLETISTPWQPAGANWS